MENELKRKLDGAKKSDTASMADKLLADAPASPDPAKTHDTDTALAALVAEAATNGVRPVNTEIADNTEYAPPVERATAVKTMRPMVDVNPAQRVAEASAQAKTQAMFVFISRYPKLTIYVDLGAQLVERDGKRVMSHRKVEFRNGYFSTQDEKLAAAITSHPRCNTSLFRAAPSQEAAVLYKTAEAARTGMRSGAQVGVTTALQGNDTQFFSHDAQLVNMQDRVFRL